MESKYDIAIIGSGLGGLVCGYILSRNGYKVAILEKNQQIGGCLQTFRRKGVKFETGMHYVGSMNEGEPLWRFFRYLSLLDDVKLSPLDPDGYDVVSIRGEKFPFASGRENFIESLARQFPDNRDDIAAYVDAISRVAENSPLYSFKGIGNVAMIDPDTVKMSVDESIARITQNEKLRNVLAGNLPLNAAIKDKTPFYVHALINDFYIKSAYRIMGGSDAIASSLAKSIKNMGGDIFTASHVTRIECDEAKAVAVELAGGERIAIDYVISAIHPALFVDMFDTPMMRNVYKERIRSLENSVGNFTVYIKFKPRTVPYMNHNLYHYESDDVWGMENYDAAEWPKSFLYMHQCTEQGQEFAESALIISYMRWEEVARWNGTKIGKRGTAYEEFKKERAERLLALLERVMPGTTGNIEDFWTSTPLTYQDYTGTKEGSMYGIVRDKNFPVQTVVSQRTKIPNVYLTGQNINSHGILGVTIGAIITCSEFVGLERIAQQIREG